MATQAPQHAAAARGPAYFNGPPPADAKAGPVYKTWSDEEGAVAKGDTISCCVKFKFAIWLLVVVLLVRMGAPATATAAWACCRRRCMPRPDPSGRYPLPGPDPVCRSPAVAFSACR